MDIIGLIIAGIIIGLLGKFFAPGNRDNIPLWLTVLCGIGGVLIGYYLAARRLNTERCGEVVADEHSADPADNGEPERDVVAVAWREELAQ